MFFFLIHAVGKGSVIGDKLDNKRKLPPPPPPPLPKKEFIKFLQSHRKLLWDNMSGILYSYKHYVKLNRVIEDAFKKTISMKMVRLKIYSIHYFIEVQMIKNRFK